MAFVAGLFKSYLSKNFIKYKISVLANYYRKLKRELKITGSDSTNKRF